MLCAYFITHVIATETGERDNLERAAELQPLASFVIREINFEIERNTREHNTDQYAVTRREDDARLVVRRGDAFQISITFQRRYNKRDDLVNMIFTVAGLRLSLQIDCR